MQTAGDNHPWSSEVLWDYNSLLYLNGLAFNDNDWLRGVTGSWHGHNTLTVWGKLSWGANPLAASTPANGNPDGARVNPLYAEDLQVWVNLANILTGGSYPGCGNVRQDDGFAVRIVARPGSSLGSPELYNYSSQAFADCSGTPDMYPYAVANYYLTVPVPDSVQFQNITLFFSVNTSTGSPPYTSLYAPISGCDLTYTFSVDMLQPPPLATSSGLPAHTLYGNLDGKCKSGEPSTKMRLGYTAVPAGVKAPTYLWVPNDNSTLSNLPSGLQRYTGEQDFVQVVANVPLGCAITCELSSSVPDPWGHSYQVTANQSADSQLVNFLIPRSQFLNSPMGQAILAQSPLSTTNSAPDQIAGESLQWLACYWQGHAVAPSGTDGSTGPTLCGSDTNPLDTWTGGSAPGTPYAVTTLADTSCSASPANCAAGGVPSNPALVSGCAASSPSCASPSLQAVFTLNLTTDNDLSDLLAGLLDNSTTLSNGELGVSGWLKPVTYELPTLGLNSVVMGALASASQPNGGIFGYPMSQATPPQPPCNWGCALWNAVSGVFTAIVNGATMLVGVVWNAAVAADHYFDQAVQGLAKDAEAVVAATVSTLKAVGAALEAALLALISYVEALVTAFIDAALAPVVSLLTQEADGYESPVASALCGCVIDTQSSPPPIVHPPSPGLAAALFGTFTQSVIAMSVVIVVAVTVAITALQGITLGLGVLITFLLAILLPPLITKLLQVLPLPTLPAFVGSLSASHAWPTAFSATTSVIGASGIHLGANAVQAEADLSAADYLGDLGLVDAVASVFTLFFVGAKLSSSVTLGINLAMAVLGILLGIALAKLPSSGNLTVKTEIGKALAFETVATGIIGFMFTAITIDNLGTGTLKVPNQGVFSLLISILAGIEGGVIAGGLYLVAE